MMRPWHPIKECTAQRDKMAAIVPVLETERLVLRAQRAEDWPVLEPIWRTDRGRYIDGPFNEEDAWLDYCQAAAGWMLRGIGYWTVTLKSDATVLGLIGIGQETADPELEFGWLLTQEAEGQGFAFEATKAIRAYAFETVGLKTLVSMIDRKNTRSVALAERLGATKDVSAVPTEFRHDTTAYRHVPERLQ